MKTMEEMLQEQITNNAIMVVDHEYRMILMELGLTEEGETV